jgi:uncharacterized membrane protein YfcA
VDISGAQIVFLLLAFLAGAFVKGLSGIGMPLFVIPILLQFVPLQTAIAIMIVPVVLSNILQILDWHKVCAAARRFWSLLIVLPIGIAIGNLALLYLDPRQLDVLIGMLIGTFACFGLFRITPAAPTPNEKLWNPIVGAITGVLGGFSSFYGPPIAFYLLTLKMPRDVFIVTSALIFSVAGAALNILMIVHGMVGWHDILLSTVSIAPVAAGLLLGNYVRRFISQAVFDKIILWFLVAIALNQIRRGLGW